LTCHGGMEYLVWSVTITLILLGLLGCVVPLMPGTTLILLGILLQKWVLPHTLTWQAVVWIAVFWLLSVVADVGCTMLGTRLLGGGKWGMAGATGGALAGMFFSLPALLLGTIFGAVLAEKWLGKKTDKEAMKAGAGAVLGFLMSGFARLGCALVMIGLYALSVYNSTGKIAVVVQSL
jgi:uncharacterized protein